MAWDPMQLDRDGPAPPRAAPYSRWRRAFDGVNGRRFAMALVFCGAWALSLQLTSIDEYWQQAQMLSWLGRAFGTDFGCILLITLLGGATVVAAFNLGPPRGLRRVALLASAVALSGLLGGVVRYGYMVSFGGEFSVRPSDWFLWLTRYGELATLLVIVVEAGRRKTRSLDALHEAEIDRLALDHEVTEARLQVLQAQIEPHFLFNTLATVRRLYATDAATGSEMLGNLMRYLEVALPQMRAGVSTLGREIDLVEAYLDLQRVRMGARLAYRIDVPASLRGVALPSMMVITLVENAIKHGLNDLPEGGVVCIAAAVEGSARLRIEVADDGAGFREAAGGGTGLANIRARLGALYGVEGRLDLALNRPRGVVATIRVPCVAA